MLAGILRNLADQARSNGGEERGSIGEGMGRKEEKKKPPKEGGWWEVNSIFRFMAILTEWHAFLAGVSRTHL